MKEKLAKNKQKKRRKSGTKLYSRFNSFELDIIKAACVVTKLDEATFIKAACLNEASKILEIVKKKTLEAQKGVDNHDSKEKEGNTASE